MSAMFKVREMNRRGDYRDEVSRSAEYICTRGLRHRTMVNNVSLKGARLITGPEVNVGDRIQLVCSFAGQGAPVLVRWSQALPGGNRQLVGIEAV